MDHAEVPKVVLEAPAPCSDAARAEELLRRTLAPTRAPSAAWTVWMRVTRAPADQGGALRGEGEITDAASAPVAHRDFVDASSDCAALARAVGVWASLVLDQELARSRAAADVAASTLPAPSSSALPHDDSMPESSVWPAPATNEKARPEQSMVLEHEEHQRTVESGASMFIMGGTGTGALAGPSLFGFIEVGHGVFLRPMLAVGRTIEALKPSTDVYGTLGIARFDACFRLPGLYLENHGIQLDACGGTDIGFLHFDAMSANQYGLSPRATDARTIPFLAVGPSIGLRGELGSELAVEVRGVVGLNLIRINFSDPVAGAYVDPPLFGGRGELGLSWRWR